jgi:hypothetical protein
MSKKDEKNTFVKNFILEGEVIVWKKTYLIYLALTVIVFSIANYFGEIKKVLNAPTHPVVNTPQNIDHSSLSALQSKEDPFKKFLEQKSNQPATGSLVPTQGTPSKLENATDPFKEFLDKQKTQNSLSGVNPFEQAGKK